MFDKPKRWESAKYRDAAKGQPCTMRLPGVCNGDWSTTVLAHRNGAGMGMKASDHDAADMCHACHDFYDKRKWNLDAWIAASGVFETARLETIINRIERGILK